MIPSWSCHCPTTHCKVHSLHRPKSLQQSSQASHASWTSVTGFRWRWSPSTRRSSHQNTLAAMWKARTRTYFQSRPSLNLRSSPRNRRRIVSNKSKLAMKISIDDHPELFPKLINPCLRISIRLSAVEQWNMIFISVLVLGNSSIVSSLTCDCAWNFTLSTSFLNVFLTWDAADLNSHLREWLNYDANCRLLLQSSLFVMQKKVANGCLRKEEDRWQREKDWACAQTNNFESEVEQFNLN